MVLNYNIENIIIIILRKKLILKGKKKILFYNLWVKKEIKIKMVVCLS